MLCDSYKNRRFGGLYRLRYQGDKNGELRLLVTAIAVPSLPIPVTLKMEAVRPFETSFLTRATWRYIPEDLLL
jgi:hypothetical protein